MQKMMDENQEAQRALEREKNRRLGKPNTKADPNSKSYSKSKCSKCWAMLRMRARLSHSETMSKISMKRKRRRDFGVKLQTDNTYSNLFTHIKTI